MSTNQHLPGKLWRLFSIMICVIMIFSFITPISAITVVASSGPQLNYPGNYANTTTTTDPPLGVPSFSWYAVEGATMYRLQLDSEIGFNEPILLDITTPNTSFTPISMSQQLFADGDWFWRVRVDSPAPVSDWSEIRQFNKTWGTEANKPALLEPGDGATLAFFDNPVFSWSRVMGAAKYRFQIALSPDGFNSPILTYDTLASTTQPPNRLANATYYWRVIPMDKADHLGTTSEVYSFDLKYGTFATHQVPVMIEPLDLNDPLYEPPTFTPTFKWTAIEGAEHYRLEYTSNETCDYSEGVGIDTRMTSYTPTDTFPNDKQYCWHVRAESGTTVGEWSTTWRFQKQWYLQPKLLTPTNLYETGLYPTFSWTPVPGASSYFIQIASNQSFVKDGCYEEYTTANTTFSHQRKYCGTLHYYWKVTPIDGGDEIGRTSNVAEYQTYYTSTAPILVYPLYYYLPNDPTLYEDNTMNPVEDRTVAYPIFMWHRVMIPSPDGGVYAKAYRIEVDDSSYFFNPEWVYETENTIATPTSNVFDPIDGLVYHWRVCPLTSMGGVCEINPITGQEWWSQAWKARFDDRPEANLVLESTIENVPLLLRPALGHESIESTPFLEWWPMEGATQYQIEIDRDPYFSTVEISNTATVDFPAYAPWYSIAQRSLGRTDFGTFYWHVRGLVGAEWSGWSDTWRFQIASQSEWRYDRYLGNIDNKLLIGDDILGDTPDTYDLSSLYAAQSGGYSGLPGYWFLGFNANLDATDKTFVIYIDQDHIDGSGATVAPAHPDPSVPSFSSITTIPAHQPEYVIYVDLISGTIDANNTWVFAWDGNSWGDGQKLSLIGGYAYSNENYVELQLWNASIGMQETTGSASVMLVSVDRNSGIVYDSVPSDPNVPGSIELSRFSAVSDRMNLIFPPNTVTGDPTTIPSMLPFYWDWPTGSFPSNPFAGSVFEVHLDPTYTNRKAILEIKSDANHFSQNNSSLVNDVVGDNIYYWRVRPRYWINGYQEAFGTWSGGWSFRRRGFFAQNLETTVITTTPSINWELAAGTLITTTPTFSWDMVEGADSYRLQVSTDPNFGSTMINITTPMNSYTPQDSLPIADYYWRVFTYRYPNIENSWSEVLTSTVSLPTPYGLTLSNDLENDGIVSESPSFCWKSMKGYDEDDNLVLTAWKYRLQVSRDENFSNIYDSIDTNNNCWTPTMGYADGTYYWHIAMIDGNSRVGPYSNPAATFVKQYPVTNLISPISGKIPSTPTFIWEPVAGAANYRFEVSIFDTFSPLYDTTETINTHFTPTKMYTTGQVYYWRVAIRDYNGNQGPFTDAVILIGGNRFYLPVIAR